MTYASALEEAPPELRLPLLRFAEALEVKMRDQLAVRREDLDALRSTVHELAEAQTRTEERIGRLEGAVTELAEAQRRSEERIGRLEGAVTELAEAQRRSEERIGRLEGAVTELAEAQRRTEQRIEELAEAQKRTEQRIEELAEAQKRTEQRIEELTEAQKRTEQRMDDLQRTQLSMAGEIGSMRGQLDRFGREQDKQKGDRLERQYREKPFAYFGRLLRRAQVVPLQEIEDDLEGRLSEEELDTLRPLDLLVRGRLRDGAQVSGDVWLALEVSAMVDRSDVERAQQRGAILRRAGYLVVSGVAGEGVTQGGVEAAQAEKVVLLRNGTIQFWEAALAQALTAEVSASGR